jgi:hypothetical protein
MTIPEQVKVGAHTFSIHYVESFSDDRLAETDYVKQRINIVEALSPTMRMAALIHEVHHVMNTTMDHTLLDSISEQLTQVLVDNDMLK